MEAEAVCVEGSREHQDVFVFAVGRPPSEVEKDSRAVVGRRYSGSAEYTQEVEPVYDFDDVEYWSASQ